MSDCTNAEPNSVTQQVANVVKIVWAILSIDLTYNVLGYRIHGFVFRWSVPSVIKRLNDVYRQHPLLFVVQHVANREVLSHVRSVVPTGFFYDVLYFLRYRRCAVQCECLSRIFNRLRHNPIFWIVDCERHREVFISDAFLIVLEVLHHGVVLDSAVYEFTQREVAIWYDVVPSIFECLKMYWKDSPTLWCLVAEDIRHVFCDTPQELYRRYFGPQGLQRRSIVACGSGPSLGVWVYFLPPIRGIDVVTICSGIVRILVAKSCRVEHLRSTLVP